MRHHPLHVIIALTALLLASQTFAAAADDIQALKDAKALLDAQSAKDQAEAAAIKAASELEKAKAAAANAAKDIQQSQAAADAKALLDAQAAKDTAEAAAIKAASELQKAKAAAASAAPSLEQSQAAANAKILLDAQAAKDTAEAAAITATASLAKAKATAANISNEIRQAQFASDAALTKAEVGADTAEVEALKAAFGAAPTIGADGNIAITDATGGMLLQVKAGSLATTWQFAESLCQVLVDNSVTNAYFAPVDLDTKIQSARMVLREFTVLSELVQDKENRRAVGLEGAQAQFTAAGALSALTLLQYGAGALQSVSKMFRADYAVALSSDATRAAWLEYFMSGRCPAQIPQAQMEAVVRNQSIDEAIRKLDELQQFGVVAGAAKAATQKDIQDLTARIAQLKANGEDTAAFEEVLKAHEARLARIVTLDAWLPRLQSLISTVSSSPNVFLDALTWHAFGDANNPLQIPSRPRVVVVLTTQDGQVTKSFWLTGKTVYGRSAGELIYRIQNAGGTVAAAGYMTSTASTGKIKFGRSDADKVDKSHIVPASPKAAGK